MALKSTKTISSAGKGMPLAKLSLGRNNLIITAREEFGK
jgi:hypothetical protein